MSLSSNQLDAFFATARHLSFSKAAKELYVTQSALSQRITKLEGELNSNLFIRGLGKLRLTPMGIRLLKYVKVRDELETEFLSEVHDSMEGELTGMIRIAGYSSVLRSIIIPAAAGFLKEHPRVRCDFQSREMMNLPELLLHSEVDFIVTNSHINRPEVISKELCIEENVLVQSKKHKQRNHFMLDHDADDMTTESFFKMQSQKPPEYERIFFDEIYGLLDGVANGLGRAVVSKHLITPSLNVEIVKKYKPMKNKVMLHYQSLPHTARVKKQFIRHLNSYFSK